VSTDHSRRLRILALGFRGFPGVQGGIETHAEQLYTRLQSLDCDVEAVVRSRHMTHARASSWHGIRYRRLWSPRGSGLEAAVHTLLGTLFAIVHRPDVIHYHAVGPALFAPLARACGLRVVVTHHGPDYEREKWGLLARAILKAGEHLGMRHAHERIAISTTIARLVEEKHGVHSSVIRNGVDLPTLGSGTEAIAALGLTRGRYLLCVGRLVPEKRQIDLIDAFAKAGLEGWKLAVVGATTPGDPHVRRVLARAAEVPGIVCTGFRGGAELAQLYEHAGLFVQPSSHEGLPIALLEALSYGLPVLASDIPAHRECPLDQDAYFPMGNIRRLVDGMRSAIAEPITTADRERRRAIVAALCDWDAIARETLGVYRRATQRAIIDDTAGQPGHDAALPPATPGNRQG